jgi:hypothetical protein
MKNSRKHVKSICPWWTVQSRTIADWIPFIAILFACVDGTSSGWIVALLLLDRNRRRQHIDEKKLNLQGEALKTVCDATNEGIPARMTSDLFSLETGQKPPSKEN